jgi:hypothetical protein
MKKAFACLAVVFVATGAKGQFDDITTDSEYFNELRTITTAVPIMAVTPDARAAGMGDLGAATSPDANSLYWNPAKLAFLPDGSNSLSVSYSPWLQDLVADINLAYVAYNFKVNDNSAAAVGLRYFSLGEINFRDELNNDNGTFQPYEFALSGAYSLKLSDRMSLAVGLRWIFSDLTQGQQVAGTETKPGQSLAADIGYYYTSREYNMEGGRKQSFTAGAVISNLGSKISYSNSGEDDFIPANLRIGGGYHLQLDKYNKLSFYADVNKLLVPTPPIREGDQGYTGDLNNNNQDNDGSVLIGQDDNVNFFQGAIQSFNDAPGGGSEELEELVFNLGAEFWYNNQFAFRGGYQYEDMEKGGRQYFTLGLGFKYNVFGLDFAYLIPANPLVRSPLENSLRFTLLFDFENVASAQ